MRFSKIKISEIIEPLIWIVTIGLSWSQNSEISRMGPDMLP